MILSVMIPEFGMLIKRTAFSSAFCLYHPGITQYISAVLQQPGLTFC
jgi:hypothetical protein